MASTFGGIELAKRGLIAHQQAIQTTGHNVTNADTEGYSRQRVVFSTEHPLYDPTLNRPERAGQVGQGVNIARIQRIRDAFIDDRIIDIDVLNSYWKTMQKYLHHIELVHNEPSEYSVREALDRFWEAWQELANNPSELATRKVVKERGEALARIVNNVYSQLKDIQNNLDFVILQRVKKINELGKKIRDLNVEIKKSIAAGDMPNDLMDKRDKLIEELSNLVNIDVYRNDEEEFIVYIDGEHFVQGEHFEPLLAVENPNKIGYHDIVWQGSRIKVNVQGGELKALLDLRDVELKQQIDQINNFAVNLIESVNEIHRDGFGIDGVTNRNFFAYNPITPQVNGDFDSNNDGILDATGIFKITGLNTLDENATIGINGTITFDSNTPGGTPITVNYVATDTVADVIRKINNSGAEVVAYLDHLNRLVLKATLASDDRNKDFVIRHIEDSGNFLVNYAGILRASGAGGAYDWRATGAVASLQVPQTHYTVAPLFNPASWMSLDEEIKNDVLKIAAAGGTDYTGNNDPDTMTGVGDGTNALKIAQLRYKNIMVGEYSTFDDYYSAIISDVGAKAEKARIEFETGEKIHLALKNLRESISGVNIDEEIANLISYQHGYAASARVISVMNSLLDIIINRIGI